MKLNNIGPGGYGTIGSQVVLASHIIKIYCDGIFLGYIKNYRLFKNGYRFNKTKNLELAKKFFIFYGDFEIDKFFYKKSYTFKYSKITKQEIRKSKLNKLSIYKHRTSILKQEIK